MSASLHSDETESEDKREGARARGELGGESRLNNMIRTERRALLGAPPRRSCADPTLTVCDLRLPSLMSGGGGLTAIATLLGSLFDLDSNVLDGIAILEVGRLEGSV